MAASPYSQPVPSQRLNPVQPRSGSVSVLAPKMNDIDTNSKIRSVELSLLDFKGAMERRLTEITAELPTKLAREIRALEARESLLAKDVGSKLASFQE